jgi:hypothetical protein
MEVSGKTDIMTVLLPQKSTSTKLNRRLNGPQVAIRTFQKEKKSLALVRI